MKIRKEKFTSAGSILFYRNKIVLLFHHQKRIFVLPKGRRKKGETLKQTALRETMEETGFRHLQYVRKLGRHQYIFVQGNAKNIKTVHVYLVELLDKTKKSKTQMPNEKFSNRFFPYAEAMKRLKWEADRKLLRKARGFIDNI